ncbi:hypothetical protein IFM89_003914 [Coptis chinensis]|uniref:Uncharacterized protein n=1 Tax=Coptis chinensis TaxID=261450 RepID=A0A835IJN4_9MAGN|nr:hypothetical protein IFM89_003914 [Coptis chinensis]
MRNGGKLVSKNRSKLRSVKKDSDSDEDYVLNEDDDEYASEDSFDLNTVAVSSDEEEYKRRKVVRPKKDSLDGKETGGWRSVKKTIVSDYEEDDCDFDDEVDEDDEEFRPDEIEENGVFSYAEEKKRKVVRSKDSKKTRVSLSVKRSKVSDDEEEEYVFDDEDEEFKLDEIEEVGVYSDDEKKKRKVVRSKDLKKTRVSRSVKRNSVSDDEEEEEYVFDDVEDEDEEFNPDEIEFGDEEEELHIERRVSVMRKPVPRKKASVKSLKRKRKSKALKKAVRKKPKRTVMRKPVSSDDDFDLDYKAVRERSRTKSVIKDWVSDDSEPSDVEYTLSDEEKELLREANKFLGISTTCSRDSSLNGKLHKDGASKCLKPTPMERKGKQKVHELHIDTGKQVCGICFSEERKGIVRGTLNCCSHYFCYACIMEWSKIESRCPLCKQRFVTISMPERSKLGVELRSLVIPIPTRDQVYQPTEEEMMGYLDPYDGVVCIECQEGGDDSLMLLCDICDSPSHTYCVGLGQEVPEGNWYCKGCRISDPGSSNVLVQDPSLGTSSNSIPTFLTSQRMSVNDLDPTPQAVSALDPSLFRENEILPSPRSIVGDDVHLVSPSGIGVSTLSGRRRIHRQIRSMLSNNRVSHTTEMPHRIDDNIESEIVADSEDEQLEKTTTQQAGPSASNGFHSDGFEVWTQDASPSSLLEIDNTAAQSSNIEGNSSASQQSNSVFGCQQLQHHRSSLFSWPDDCEFPRQRRSSSSHFQVENPLE